jgi:hypothetical protein
MVASNAVVSSAASAASSSLAASQYICPSGGSPSGSNCNYGATAYTDYSCPGWSGLNITAGGCQTGGQLYYVMNNGLNHACFQGSGGSYACCLIDGYGESRSPACTAFTNYYCSGPGTRVGGTCTYAASIG